jgi:hypothetical protein
VQPSGLHDAVFCSNAPDCKPRQLHLTLLVAAAAAAVPARLVSDCAAAVVSVMLGDAPPPLEGVGEQALHECTYHTLSRVEEVQQEHWWVAGHMHWLTRHQPAPLFPHVHHLGCWVLCVGSTPPLFQLSLAVVAPGLATMHCKVCM